MTVWRLKAGSEPLVEAARKAADTVEGVGFFDVSVGRQHGSQPALATPR